MKKALKRTAAACLLTLSVLLSGEAFAQNNVVGRVVDSNNVPLIGVNVVVKGTTTGTTTGVDGNYAIKVAENQTLVFSYLGYTTVEEMVGKRTAINVKMTEEATQLGAVEIVNIGYGTTTRRDLTGSVAKADLGTMMKANVTSFDQALGGRIAGVVVTTGDGSLGAEANITIRGNNSLTQSNAPLYIIDGFPSEGSFATSINPADIESIDVLKDASATAIYGARGANGVIVINTKRGKEGKPTVNFSASFSMSHIANKIDLMDGYEFVRLQDELVSPTSMESSYYSYSEELGRNLTLDDYRNIPGIDWQDELYRTAFQQNYNVSLSGGTKEGLRYNVGFSALDQDGIIIRSNFQRYQGKANFTLPITKKLSLNANVNYSRTATNGVNPTTAETTSSSSGWLMYSVWGYRPVGKPGQDLLNTIIDESVDGSNDYRFNPVKTAQNEYRKTLVDYLNSNIALTWKITPELTFKTTGGYVLNKRRREEFNGTETYTGYPGSPSGKGVNGAIYWTDQTSWTNENTLNYKRRFGRNHNVDMMVGLSLQGQNNTYEGISSTQITSEELGIAGIYTGSYQSVPSNYYDWRMMSMFLRANYNFRYKYYLTFSFRADGSSKFPAGNRWGYFPSVGASWNFNRENLFKKSDWLTNGKLRFSWGLTGNNRTQTPYDFYSQITVTPGSGDSFDYVFDGKRVPGYYFSNMANDRLKWETTEQWNVGIDLGFFDNRLKVTADWYDKVTRDLLLYALLPATSGYEQGMLNIGKIRNRGFEFTLETVNIKTRQFQWSTSFNIAFNRNRIPGEQTHGHDVRLHLRRNLQARRFRRRRQSEERYPRLQGQQDAARRHEIPRHERRRKDRRLRPYDHRLRPAPPYGRLQQQLHLEELRPEHLLLVELRQRHSQRQPADLRVGLEIPDQPAGLVCQPLDPVEPDLRHSARSRYGQRGVFVARDRGRFVPAAEKRLARIHHPEPPVAQGRHQLAAPLRLGRQHLDLDQLQRSRPRGLDPQLGAYARVRLVGLSPCLRVHGRCKHHVLTSKSTISS